MKRSTFVASALAALLLPFAASAQTDWPTEAGLPGRALSAGRRERRRGARAYAEKLSVGTRQAVHRSTTAPARATTVASNLRRQGRAADGYTIYAGGTSLVINPTLTGQVQYDPNKSFELVSLMSFTPFILHVNAEFPAQATWPS
jgi:hypothetical protein